MKRLPVNRLLLGDARTALAKLPSNSIDCVVTSPPYFRLRDYQDSRQIGLENHVDDWVKELLGVCSELKRLLKSSGSFWLNLGDSYSRKPSEGAIEKSLLQAPERLAIALAADGWILRNKVVWAKTNPMPTSVRDRLSCAHELVYFFVRSKRYYFDLDAIRIPHLSTARPSRRPSASWSVPSEWRGPSSGRHEGLGRLKRAGLPGHPLGKNPGDVWSLATAGYRGQHHAVFPERLIEKPILATCPRSVCCRCGKPWTRDRCQRLGSAAVAGTLHPNCTCGAKTRPGTVLDPFMGSGTVAAVASRLGRRWLGVDINPSFKEMVSERLRHIDRAPPPGK